MGDIQQWFIDNGVRNYEPGIRERLPHRRSRCGTSISQLRIYIGQWIHPVEYRGHSRGMDVDAFAPSLKASDEWTPNTPCSAGWRAASGPLLSTDFMVEFRSQRLKYHIQTSGRSLHSREIQFNDIRTTLQALLALYDNCNSLHTNAYDEAVTTPTEESVPESDGHSKNSSMPSLDCSKTRMHCRFFHRRRTH